MKNFLRQFVPCKNNELNIFLPLFGIKLCVSFIYSVLTTIKDTIVVTASGAEVIPILKGGVVIIAAFVVMLAYTKLSNYIKRKNMFYVMILPFLIFFAVYGFILYPYQNVLIPTTSATWLLEQVGANHQHWVAVYKYWMHALFFVIAELWGGVVIGLLFWGFANQITNIKDAAKFYVVYTIGGHIGSLISGGVILVCSNIFKGQSYDFIMRTLMLLAIGVGILIVKLYWHTNKKLQTAESFDIEVTKKELNSKSKLSLKESILYIIRSPYLGLIALMVISYGLSVNLVEVSWKALVKLQYPNPSDYQAYMGLIQLILGSVSIVLAIFFSTNLMRKFGWYICAQLTPIVLGICSIIFLALFLTFPSNQYNQPIIFGATPLLLLVICGGIHNIACKAMKYCVFDTTKEMAYIPLDMEAKTKGKAAVDLVSARFGKTGSSWIQILLIDLIGGGSILGVAALLIPIVILVVGVWMRAVFNLNKRFTVEQDTKESTGYALET